MNIVLFRQLELFQVRTFIYMDDDVRVFPGQLLDQPVKYGGLMVSQDDETDLHLKGCS